MGSSINSNVDSRSVATPTVNDGVSVSTADSTKNEAKTDDGGRN